MPGGLADEFASLGVSSEDRAMMQDGPKALARARAAQVLCRKFANRDRVKAQLLEDQEMSRQRARQNREDKRRRWKQKTSHSPFLVDLVAENERLDEENRVRVTSEGQQLRELDRQRVSLKQQIIVRALREDSDLDALRREKRAIVDEERRLKALLDLEKVQGHKKLDMQAAHRAEKQRRAARTDMRRHGNLEAINKMREIDRMLLREASDAPAYPDNTFSRTELAHGGKL